MGHFKLHLLINLQIKTHEVQIAHPLSQRILKTIWKAVKNRELGLGAGD